MQGEHLRRVLKRAGCNVGVCDDLRDHLAHRRPVGGLVRSGPGRVESKAFPLEVKLVSADVAASMQTLLPPSPGPTDSWARTIGLALLDRGSSLAGRGTSLILLN